MRSDQLERDIEFLRRRQHWLESRILTGGEKSYDKREAHCLDRVCSLLEEALVKGKEKE